MKSGNFIIPVGVTLIIVFAIFAFIHDEDDVPSKEAANTAVNPNRWTAQQDMAMNQMPGQGMNQMPGQGMNQMPAKQRTPRVFTDKTLVRFSGIVDKINMSPTVNDRIHILVKDKIGNEKQVSLGPSWFLTYTNCTIAEDIAIDGKGFKFDPAGTALIYAKKIRINGQVCRFRNDEGFALWSDKLR
ncbi:MAG: hypothetical protein HQM14_18110 [SAR324 cluster bacterium]|nr:hypothetical protein [SAR324 cluster bacterium]